MFISNDCTFFHLWWKKNLVKHQKASRSYEMVIDCYTIQISYHNWNIWARFKIQCWQHLLSIIAKMQNIWDLIGQNSTHLFIFLMTTVQILVECEIKINEVVNQKNIQISNFTLETLCEYRSIFGSSKFTAFCNSKNSNHFLISKILASL